MQSRPIEKVIKKHIRAGMLFLPVLLIIALLTPAVGGSAAYFREKEESIGDKETGKAADDSKDASLNTYPTDFSIESEKKANIPQEEKKSSFSESFGKGISSWLSVMGKESEEDGSRFSDTSGKKSFDNISVSEAERGESEQSFAGSDAQKRERPFSDIATNGESERQSADTSDTDREEESEDPPKESENSKSEESEEKTDIFPARDSIPGKDTPISPAVESPDIPTESDAVSENPTSFSKESSEPEEDVSLIEEASSNAPSYSDFSEEESLLSKEEEEDDGTFYITVYNTAKETVQKMPLEEYVLRALASEMTASAPLEALKAQAVAIRSYAVAKAALNYKCHHGAMICDSYEHCMAMKTEEQYQKIYKVYRETYEQAVKETEGMVLTYEGKPATTYFHWCSYNRTASALSVFGKEEPYLVSVPTSVDVPMYQQYEFSRQALLTELLGKTTCKKLMEKEDVSPIGGITETDSGRVSSVLICGVEISGEHFRDTLNFRSTDFDVGYNPQTDCYTFTVYGSGHGVGMSQSGAKVMAKEGKTFEEILYHYYRGTKLVPIDEEMISKP